MRISTADARYARDVHDASPPLLTFVLSHFWDGVLGHQNHTCHVDLHTSSPLSHVDLDGGPRCSSNPDDIDENVDPTEGRDCRVDGGLTFICIRDVGLDRDCFAEAFSLNQSRCLVGKFGFDVQALTSMSMLLPIQLDVQR